MKLSLALVAIVGFVAVASEVMAPTYPPKYADKAFLEKQKFLFEIVYRVEDPLMFDEYIKYAENFKYDKSYFTEYDYYMDHFYKSYEAGFLLPKGEFFGAYVKTHHAQAWGLFNFFYYAKDFDTFMKSACWARVHVNEGMFVYALTLAVIHRDDFEGLMLPTIYEIFPQHFFNSKFIYQAEKFDYDIWSKLVMYEKEYKDFLYKDYKELYDKNFYFYTRDWKAWQWWKMMGLDEHFYLEDKFFLRDNISKYNKDSTFLDIIKEVDIFWMPVDYTRDIEIFNEHSKLSYFTEDLDWNAYWYYFNMDYAFFMQSKKYGFADDRRGEYWIYTVQQILARYYNERLAHGFGEIPQYSGGVEYEVGYDPKLISYNGAGFTYRKNYYEYTSVGHYDNMHRFYAFYKRIAAIVQKGFYTTADGKVIDMRKPESVEILGNMLQGNADYFDKYFYNSWKFLTHMYHSNVDYYDFDVVPNLFLNFETELRDPFFYSFYRCLTTIFFKFSHYLQPYKHEELFFPGVTISEVSVDKLVTYFDFTDFDVSTLLNTKMVFDSGKFVWDKTLLARQQRLNHKPFSFDFTIESDKPQKVVVRTFYGPKFDEFGRTFSLAENRHNFVEIDEFVYQLVAGKNTFKRSSKDFYFTIGDRTTYTELYKYVMYAYEGKYDFPLDASKPHCGFPDRLLLPQGLEKGYPMQFFFYVTPYTASYEKFPSYDYTYSCGIGSGQRHIDGKPFGYPFDRPIDEFDFYVPNMYFKDVKVYHEDKFAVYYEKKYEHFGKFDYSF